MVKKSLGQNFLIDKNKIVEIINSLPNLNQEEVFLEIGPGKGALTSYIIPNVKTLLAIEIDQEMVKILNEKFQEKNFILFHKNVLNVNFDQFLENYDSINFVSNLPYYIASKIIFKAVENKKIKNISVMIQEEMAQRILAIPDNKNFGRLTVALNTFFDVKKTISVPAQCFYPQPKVNSKFLILERNYNNSINFEEINDYLLFIKICFAHKRKTLLNSLKNHHPEYFKLVKNYFKENNINLRLRAENFSTEDYVKLWKAIN